MDDEWARRSRSFGAVAEAYDRFRPGYPDAVLDDVAVRAGVGGGGGRVLEAGAGTGRATVALAARGLTVVAVEPDPEMAAVARRATVGMDVTVVESGFEEYAAEPSGFSLVASAQAWHWVDDERGLARAASALRPGGSFCAWWNRPADIDGPAWRAVQAAYAEHAPELFASHVHEPSPPPLLPEHACFSPWELTEHDWTATYDAAAYTGMVATHSDHVLLEAARRERLLEAVGAAIDRVGGELEYRYRTVMLSSTRV